jgi:hypothetical protein
MRRKSIQKTLIKQIQHGGEESFSVFAQSIEMGILEKVPAVCFLLLQATWSIVVTYALNYRNVGSINALGNVSIPSY